MECDRVSLKQNAERICAAAQPRPWKPTLVYLILNYILLALREKLSERTQDWVQALRDAARAGMGIPNIDSIMLISQLFIMLLTLLAAVLTAGYVWYALKLLRSRQTAVESIFDGFGQLGKLLLINILCYIFTLLWTLLLVFPGVIASYRYRLAVYVLADHPEYSALQCISESKRLMKGRKLDLFVLDLSFIGWYILCAITAGILLIWKQPYFEVTYAGFYECAARFGGGYRDDNQSENAPPWEL